MNTYMRSSGLKYKSRNPEVVGLRPTARERLVLSQCQICEDLEDDLSTSNRRRLCIVDDYKYPKCV